MAFGPTENHFSLQVVGEVAGLWGGSEYVGAVGSLAHAGGTGRGAEGEGSCAANPCPKLTVALLRAELQERNLDMSGLKPLLVERLQQALRAEL